ncbi:MAG: DNA adenine methylase [Halococcoides sp.]
MKSVFPYIGGKTRLAGWIIDHLPDHTAYVEPFGGSGAVLLAKERSAVEVFNDLDSDIVTFFQVARDRPEELADWCRMTPFSEELYREWSCQFQQGDRPDDRLEHAGRWLYLRYTTFGGKLVGKSGFKRADPGDEKGQRYARNWTNAPDRIQWVAERFQRVSIVHEDYSTVIERFDTPDTVFYLDPPYYQKEDCYHESADHEALAECLDEIDGYALVSYTEVPPGLYQDWAVAERDSTHGVGTKAKDVTERLLMNFDPAETPRFAGESQMRLGEVAAGGGES